MELNALTPLMLAVSVCIAQAPAPPAIGQGGVANAASLMPQALPGGAIARGAVFRISGPRLAAANALPVDVSIRISQGLTVVDAAPHMVSEQVIEAILPDDAPIGSANLVVTYRGLSSAPSPVRISPAAFGIYTRNRLGWGPADTMAAGPFRPGQTVELRGTGLGIRPLPLEVLVAGQPTRGSPTKEGIRFRIPRGAPEGCYVPVVARIGETVSNTAALAISRNGKACALPGVWPETSRDAPPRNGGDARGWIALARLAADIRMGENPHFVFHSDSAVATFRRAVREPALDQWEIVPPPGSCTAFAQRIALSSLGLPGMGLARGQGLDAGDRIEVRGPAGAKTLHRGIQDGSIYSAILGGNAPSILSQPSPLFLVPGDYTLSVPGASKVAPFHARIEIEQAVEWTNRDAVLAVDRRRGVTLTWTAAPGDAVLLIAGNVDAVSGALGLCACLAPAGVHQFAIPPYALANIPATPADAPGLPLSLVAVVALRGTRQDAATIAQVSASVKSVVFH